MTRLLNTPIVGRLTATVDSSSIDMLAGLSKWPILRMPPDFCANAVPGDKSSSAPTAASTQRSPIIIRLLFMTPAVTTSDAAAGPFFRAPAKRQRRRLSYFERPVHLLLGQSSDGSRIRDNAPVPLPPSREAICRA